MWDKPNLRQFLKISQINLESRKKFYDIWE